MTPADEGIFMTLGSGCKHSISHCVCGWNASYSAEVYLVVLHDESDSTYEWKAFCSMSAVLDARHVHVQRPLKLKAWQVCQKNYSCTKHCRKSAQHAVLFSTYSYTLNSSASLSILTPFSPLRFRLKLNPLDGSLHGN